MEGKGMDALVSPIGMENVDEGDAKRYSKLMTRRSSLPPNKGSKIIMSKEKEVPPDDIGEGTQRGSPHNKQGCVRLIHYVTSLQWQAPLLASP